MDNVFIGQLWRSLKYEYISLHTFEIGSEARVGIKDRIDYYNAERLYSALVLLTPEEAYARQAKLCGVVLVSRARLAA